MIGLDANVLARYYVDDAADKAVTRQRVAAKRLIESGRALMVATTVQNEAALRAALVSYGEGFAFADALHHASYAECESVATFDNKGFARKVNKRAMLPRVSIPQ